MRIRRLRSKDIPEIERIHREQGYGFELPNIGELESCYVVEHEGRVVALAGAEINAQIVMIMDHGWGSPHERMKAICRLHGPITRYLDWRGVVKAYIALDPKYRRFGARMLKIGWKEALWKHYWIKVKESLQIFCGE